MLGERGLWYKMHWFEMAARVPLLVHAPARFAPRRIGASVSTVDLLPTLVELAGGQVDPRLPLVAQKARDYLHAHFYQDIGLDELASACGTDRFRLNRAFKAAYGLPPYAYLVQLRLAKARQMLAVGGQPADLASALGFADQSHLGRWFRRAYGMTPAAYRRQCTQLPD